MCQSVDRDRRRPSVSAALKVQETIIYGSSMAANAFLTLDFLDWMMFNY